jgi:hypothetical protein
MYLESNNKLLTRTIETFEGEFGAPIRTTEKVLAWDLRNDMGVVVQIDQPVREQGALVWLPYPPDGQTIPEIAFEYPGESGRHSNTYASPGLKRGMPALRLFVRSEAELAETVRYIKAFRDSLPPPEIKSEIAVPVAPVPVDPSRLPTPSPAPSRREAIPRIVQREVWQRDGDKCVECGTKEKLCFDHIVPFSRVAATRFETYSFCVNGAIRPRAIESSGGAQPRGQPDAVMRCSFSGWVSVAARRLPWTLGGLAPLYGEVRCA